MDIEYDVIAAGHICLDMSPKFGFLKSQKVEDVFIPGRLITMNGVAFSPGGPVANTGFAIARLGLKVLPVASMGNDEFGDILGKIIKREVGVSITRKDAASTSYSFILSVPGVDRIILHDPAGNNDFCSEDVRIEVLNKAKLMHFGYPPLIREMYINDGAELVALFKKAKQTGITTSLDMSLPDTETESGKVSWNDILEKTLPYVDIFMPSIEEALFMLDKAEYERVKRETHGEDFTQHLDMRKLCELGQRIIDMGSAMALIKCGANGIYLKTAGEEKLEKMGRARPSDIVNWANKEVFRETYAVKDFKSALAGGDTTIAGFLSAMIKGYNIYDAVKIACKTGALCCTTYDSISGLLPLEEIYQRTLDEPQRNIIDINLENSSFDNDNLVWNLGEL